MPRILLLLLLAGCPKTAGIRYPDLPQTKDGALHIIAFDVGQADALLVLYGGKSLLIDCGSPLKDALLPSRRLPRRLDALLGKRHVDYFLVTHYHADHVGTPVMAGKKREPSGIYALIERDGLTIGTVLDRGFWVAGKPGYTQRDYESAVHKWLATGVAKERRVVKAGDRIDMGPGLAIEVIAASGNGLLDRMNALFPSFYAKAPPSENDYSVALKISLGDFEMFTGGDLTGMNVVRDFGRVRQSYNDVESRVAESVGAVEVYRVNHHGSAHSTNECFAQVLHPIVSIISTGVNSYGHPHPEVYHRLKKYGDVYITSGADPEVYSIVERDIVADDVELQVAPDGSRFWVNGREYRTMSDAEEKARPNSWAMCQDRTGEAVDPKAYEAFDRRDDAVH